MDSLTPFPIDPALFRAARALPGLGTDDLARAAEVGVMDVERLEADGNVPPQVAAAVRRAMERRGVHLTRDGLYRVAPKEPPASRTERIAAAQAIAARFAALPMIDPRPSEEIVADIYDENGLPR